MNEVLKNLWSQTTSASGPVKVALGSCGLLLALVTSVMVWRAQNPHFVVLASDLDSHSFNGAVKALAEAGVRYETSVGGPPYVIQVESGRRHEAIAAMHISGEFLDDARGISSGLQGSSAVFLGQSERHQRTQKRMWEEVEMSLEKLNFVSNAKVTVSGAPTSTLASLRRDARRASVIVTLRGVATPTATETRALVGLVRGGTGVTDERMTIVDQHSNVLFDGVDESGADSLAAKEEQFNRERTEMAQRQLDRVFGPGVAVVGVTSEWLQIQEESIVETLNPAKKPLSSRTRTTSDPEWPQSIGGPAGVAANTSEGGPTTAQRLSPGESTSSEEQQLNSFGTTTTHTVKQPHQLQRLSVSLVVDASIADRQKNAEDILKGFLGFKETRGDQLFSIVNEIAGLERDAEGAPILPAPEKAPAPSNPALNMAMEFGLELIAGLAFLAVLLRSLKSARSSGAAGATGGASPIDTAGANSPMGARGAAAGGLGVDMFEEEVDLDALARARIEDLIREEPEKVSALLSRWALSEDVLAEAGSR
ncbi:MAG: flagellar M-ring protein FliF C-terminal domain-containing protein [Planctomycetota bacterium]|nr:flagellar M-ring protein FliF C-terminal domain-containing protein [Planctomycetota bacterium]